jgi:HEAT repeat protein
MVRVACCKSLGLRGEARSVPGLAAALRDDEEMDVRLAAAEALGNIKTPDSIAAVAVALNDRDPAMQFVGVESMKAITGKDYGGDVDAWRQVAAGNPPPVPETPSIAQRIRSAAPF